MSKSTLTKADRKYLKVLGEEIKRIILREKKYPSLDRFALEYHEDITKPTLYAICDGERDFQFSTISGLARALDISPAKLLGKVGYKKARG